MPEGCQFAVRTNKRLTLEAVPALILFHKVSTQGETRYLRSGELAKLTGVSTDTLRHYERLGVLPRPARTAAGYRQYAPAAVDRVRTVRGAIAVGFSLNEGEAGKIDRQLADLVGLRAQLQRQMMHPARLHLLPKNQYFTG